ncbi:hypothetical protein A2U01_0111136, partial [Trifolium medium]|nr:hypothetical protein [Trifolium medium]
LEKLGKVVPWVSVSSSIKLIFTNPRDICSASDLLQ